MTIPADEVMRQMAALAMETAGEFFATQADRFAEELPPAITGADALRAFARAIRAHSAKRGMTTDFKQ